MTAGKTRCLHLELQALRCTPSPPSQRTVDEQSHALPIRWPHWLGSLLTNRCESNNGRGLSHRCTFIRALAHIQPTLQHEDSHLPQETWFKPSIRDCSNGTLFRTAFMSPTATTTLFRLVNKQQHIKKLTITIHNLDHQSISSSASFSESRAWSVFLQHSSCMVKATKIDNRL